MKIRSGLVSNSSSASFTIVGGDKKKLRLLNLVLGKYNNPNELLKIPEWEDVTVGGLKNNIKKEIEETKKDIEWAEKKKEFLESLDNSPKAKKTLVTWMKIQDQSPSNPTTWSVRDNRRWERKIKPTILEEIQRTEWSISGLINKKRRAQKLLDSIWAFNPKIDDDKEVFLIEVDNYGMTQVEEAIELLEIPIIQKVQT